MPQVKNGSENRLYLSVAFGKLRQKRLNGQKVTKDTPGSTCQTTDKGESWAIEFDSVKGMIEGIELKKHDEYGEFLEILVREPGDLCAIQFKLDNRVFDQIMNYLPNIKLDWPVEINPFQYTSKAGKEVSGINVTQDPHENTTERTIGKYTFNQVKPYFSVWNDITNKFEAKNGMPSASGVDFSDKRQKMMFNIDREEFLKKELEKVIDKFKQTTPAKFVQPIPESDNEPEGQSDDLPF